MNEEGLKLHLLVFREIKNRMQRLIAGKDMKIKARTMSIGKMKSEDIYVLFKERQYESFEGTATLWHCDVETLTSAITPAIIDRQST